MGKTGRGKNVIPASELMDRLYGENIWKGFAPKPFQMRHYSDFSSQFSDLIEEKRPSTIVELGSWYGSSAIAMAGAVKKFNLDAVIVCIDTWLGSFEHWRWTNRKQLALVNGYPSIFWQFLSNIKHAGHHDIVMPIPMTTLCGLRWLRQESVFADMIYVDASHNEWDVYADLRHCQKVLAKDGVLVGDDYTWESVRASVDRFAEGVGRKVELISRGILWKVEWGEHIQT